MEKDGVQISYGKRSLSEMCTQETFHSYKMPQ